MSGTRSGLLADISAGIGGTYELWGDLNRRINAGQVVPIISNSVVNNRIFDPEYGSGAEQDAEERDEAHQSMIDEQLATQWAEFIKYPLAESPLQLCRVAQYNQVSTGYADVAKTHYLTFLKLYLLELAMKDENVADVLDTYLQPLEGKSFAEIVTLLSDHSFSEIAYQLDYPRYESEEHNPLHLLALLPLPIYVTTSHHDFLERALKDVGKQPIVQVCSWFGNGQAGHPEPEWFASPPGSVDIADLEPTEAEPWVYHLYGLEKDPSSIVISEDDYIEFLVRVSEDKQSVPLRLRRALSQSSILLLGYRLRCWDFRVLFRGIIKGIIKSSQTQRPDRPNIAIQLDPPVQQWQANSRAMQDYVQLAKKYLEDYFTPNFRVEWDSATGFARRLLHTWREGTI